MKFFSQETVMEFDGSPTNEQRSKRVFGIIFGENSITFSAGDFEDQIQDMLSDMMHLCNHNNTEFWEFFGYAHLQYFHEKNNSISLAEHEKRAFDIIFGDDYMSCEDSDDFENSIVYLLTDIMHLCHRKNFDFLFILGSATRHYYKEKRVSIFRKD
jgi:hypothetical protein